MLLEKVHSIFFFTYSETSATAALRVHVKEFLVLLQILCYFFPFLGNKAKQIWTLDGSRSDRGPAGDELHREALLRLLVLRLDRAYLHPETFLSYQMTSHSDLSSLRLTSDLEATLTIRALY